MKRILWSRVWLVVFVLCAITILITGVDLYTLIVVCISGLSFNEWILARRRERQPEARHKRPLKR